MGRPVPLLRVVARSRVLGRRYNSSSSVAVPPEGARLRFAPSPTGYLHLGGLRTALFNHLLARKWKGKWILRIEDTDQTRFVSDAVDNLRRTLDWVGLDYDEGIGAGGSSGPYTQSERLDIYQHHCDQLISAGKAYNCFCTPDEAQAIKMSLKSQGEKRNYDGRCTHLTEEEVGRRKRAGHKHVVRFKTIPRKDYPPDLIFGDSHISGFGADDDFIILKSDRWPTYHFANVIDDHLMGITHVLRGEEWLTSLPKHHQLYSALSWTPPAFAHLPLLVNPDGSKLSKRTGDVRVDSYREKGYEPEALLNFLALMGWDHHAVRPPTSLDHPRADHNSLSELFTVDELISAFDIKHINHRKAAVDMQKLDFLNKMTLRHKAGRLGDDGNMTEVATDHEASRKELVQRLQSELRGVKVLNGSPLVEDASYVHKVLDAELARTVLLKDIASTSIFFFLEPQYDSQEAASMINSLDHSALRQFAENLEVFIPLLREGLERLAEQRDDPLAIDEDTVYRIINDVTDQLRLRAKSQIMTPLRYALTGRKKGPSVPTTMVTLGSRTSLARLEAGLKYVKKTLKDRTAAV